MEFKTIVLPKAFILDARIPYGIFDDLNAYLNPIYDSEDRRSYGHKLSGKNLERAAARYGLGRSCCA